MTTTPRPPAASADVSTGTAGPPGATGSGGGARPGAPLAASDVEAAVRRAVAALTAAGGTAAWDTPAGDLRWTCWETVEHLADSLLFYAGQLAPAEPPQTDAVPFRWGARRAGGPVNMVFVPHEAGPDGLVLVLSTCSAILAAVLRTAPADRRAHHVFGLADAEGFAAMGVVETLVHLYDVAQGLGLAWQPPGALCARVLDRLFPHVERGTGDPWRTLLWATGRSDLDGRPRLTEWRWYSAPRGTYAPGD
jgi:hypothetical protein